jgi:integrase
MRAYGSGSSRPAKTPGKVELLYRGKSRTVDAKTQKEIDQKLKAFVAELDAIAGRGGIITMGRLFDDYLADHIAHGMAETPIVEKKLDKHLRPRFGTTDAGTFGKREIKTYIAERKKEGAKNGTINRELSIIRRSLKLAAEELQRIVIIKPLPEGAKRTGTLTEEEYHWLLLKLPDWAQPVLVIAYFTGMRRGAVLELRWAWYDAVIRGARSSSSARAKASPADSSITYGRKRVMPTKHT